MFSRSVTFAGALALLAIGATAQTTVQRRPFVRATGEGVVSVRPDQAKVSVAVVNQAATADEAASQNATRTNNVLDALRKLLGSGAEIRTVSYTLSPHYNYPRDGGTPTLAGYIATNLIEVTLGDISLIGRVIDTAVQAGATRIDGMRLMLKDEEPARHQALRLATQRARARAEAIAAGAGSKVGALIAAEEGSAVRPLTDVNRMAAAQAQAATPIETGQLEIRAMVTVEYELVP